MKNLLKNLGVILVIIGAIILIAVFVSGSSAINDNTVLASSVVIIVLGLILHIILNKKITE